MTPRDYAMVGVYAFTVFLSASLLFVVQPMVGKLILPHLGGSSSVWTTCMLFFQTVLVAGYVYAHFLAKHIDPKHQASVHLALMVVATLVTLPLGVPADLIRADSAPALWLLAALVVGIGLPLFIVSTSAPLFQRWFSYTDHPDAEDPYYLYAASNLGSMIALLGYPFVVEPLIGLTNQRWAWSGGFLLLVGLTGACGFFLWKYRMPEGLRDETVADAQLDGTRRGKWVLWGFIPSSLMLGVTQYMTTDIASVPLLWVLPLAVYLLTFILVFARRPVYLPEQTRSVIPAGVLLVLAASVSELAMSMLIGAHLLLFFIITMFFHGQLAQDRPHKSKLTEFYIWMSVGGALGGIFNGLLAPALLERPVEYTSMLVVAVAVIAPNAERIKDEFNTTWIVPALIAPVGFFFLWMLRFWSLTEPVWLIIAVALVGATFAVGALFPRLENMAAAALILVGLQTFLHQPHVIEYERSFFASYAVYEREHSSGVYRKLSHGTTAHGIQSRSEELRETPLGYHHPKGPVGQVMRAVPNDRVAVVGLGAGAMAAYGGPNRTVDFYEIDPVIEEVAREYFTYLDQCGMYCTVEIGDGRKKLEAVPEDTYDIIYLDAYNSDSVPTHLLTREALEMYFRKVDDDGVIVFHVSNRYLNVEGVVGSLAKDGDYLAKTQIHRPTPELTRHLVYTSAYTVVARDETDLGPIAHESRWRPADVANVVWTDDYSNIPTVFDWDY